MNDTRFHGANASSFTGHLYHAWAIDETNALPKSEQFVWTIPGWPLKYMLDNCTGERKIKLEKAIKDGRIVPHALPITFETEASDLENLVRGLTYTQEINEKYNLPPAAVPS